MSELKHCPCGGSAKLLITDGVSESYSVFDDVMYTKVICVECSFSADDVDDWSTRAPQSEWVSVYDRLPGFHVDILFCTKHGVRAGRFYRNSHKFISSNFDKFYKCDVSHWMYLPEPPKY